MEERKFSPGMIVWTSGIDAKVQDNFKSFAAVLAALQRHLKGDWGDMGAEDKASNEDALANGQRLFSKYKEVEGVGDIYIITEWDRSRTTVLLPEEY